MEYLLPKARVLLIPGLGDRDWAYRLATTHWRLRYGYEVYVLPFGWRGGPSELAQRQATLLALFDTLATDVPICVVGGSAGGIAAINLLAERPHIHRVVTIASPLNRECLEVEWPKPYQWMLWPAAAQAIDFLEGASEETLQKITSFYGWDDTVKAAWSYFPGIRCYRLPMVCHGAIIGAGLTIFSRRLLRVLEEAAG